MSRTYRKLPHFMTKESLCRDFAEGFYHIFHCGNTFRDANHYAKAVMAKERGDAAIFKSGLREVTGIAPNGSPLGYNEWSRDRWVKRFANKCRRSNDKEVIATALAEVNEVEIEVQFDMDMGSDYDEWLLAEEESPWDDDWDTSLFVYDNYYSDDYWAW